MLKFISLLVLMVVVAFDETLAQSETVDCYGIPFAEGGSAVVDQCGVCGGNNESCCLNYLGVDNQLWDWLLLDVAIADLQDRLETLKTTLVEINDEFPEYDNGKCDGSLNDGESMVKALNVGEVLTENSNFYWNCISNFNELVPEWNCALDATFC